MTLTLTDLPPPELLQEQLPLTEQHRKFIFTSRATLANIILSKDPRLLLIMGPCSIHNIDETLEYAALFASLSAQVSDRIFMVMRTYFEKPRTLLGWKGLLYDPHLDGSFDIEEGIRLTRQLLSALTDLKIAVGSELLELTTSPYYADFLSWGCVGARTSASPPHRQLASSLEMPIGFKNTIEGNIDLPIHAIISASSPHTFVGVGQDGRLTRLQSSGNPNCHLILRGSEKGYNYYPEDIERATQKCRRAKIADRILVDCSHDNSGKSPKNQLLAFESVTKQIAEGNPNLMGLMLESYLHEGSQPLTPALRYGLSITDPCLSWQTTEKMVLSLYEKLK